MKRLFWGLEVLAPWPTEFPKGRILDSSCRHLTLAFMGQVDEFVILNQIEDIPPVPFKVGFCGRFDKCLFLPPKHPHVAAWHVQWFDNVERLELFHRNLVQWLKSLNLPVDEKETFLPHVTLARDPDHYDEWKKSFVPLPLITKDMHLYESLEHSLYKPIYTYSIKAPFEEFEHTADLAFVIRGENLKQICHHALVALAFKFPSLLKVFTLQQEFSNLDEIIEFLNKLIGIADSTEGSPFKAVSYHGKIRIAEEGLLEWEMIVDV